VLAREVIRDLVQVIIRQVLDHPGHQRILAPAVAEIAQLVVQVAGRLAGDAREILPAPPAPIAAGGVRALPWQDVQAARRWSRLPGNTLLLGRRRERAAT
jgi:hypothetical protein